MPSVAVSYTHLDVYKRQAHAAADAQGSQTLVSTAVLHSIQQGDQDTSAGSADRVTQSDCAAVDVYKRQIWQASALA